MEWVVGEVISLGSDCFQWTIHDFFTYFYKSKTRFSRDSFSLDSPLFRFSDDPCHIRIYFPGAKDFLKCSFSHKCSPFYRLNVKLGMSIGWRGGMSYLSGETDRNGQFSDDTCVGRTEFLERSDEILTDGHLTVFCELRRLDSEKCASVLQEKLPSKEKITAENEASDKEKTDSEWKTLKKMQSDFGNLLIDREDCDVTIKVQGKEFPAHRNILRARSPVFKSMFSREMVEKHRGVVVIEDCDPDTFPDFLNYVYTGSIKHISDGNVFRLYTVSDKYDVEELKEECATFIKNNMSVGTFCDTITLALLHTERELIDLATEFFCSNLIEITKTAKWQTFLQENATVGNELFIKAFSRII